MATKFYTIDDGGMFPMTVPITVFPRWPVYAPPTPDTINIWHGGKWELIKNWLIARTANSHLVGKEGWKALRRMWKANDQHFRFLELPAEMRSQIYEYALGGEIYLLSTVNRSLVNDPAGRENARLMLGLGYNSKSFTTIAKDFMPWHIYSTAPSSKSLLTLQYRSPTCVFYVRVVKSTTRF
jgi:hypothetical protein